MPRNWNRQPPYYAAPPGQTPSQRNSEWDSYINDKYNYDDHGNLPYNDYFSRPRPQDMRNRNYPGPYPQQGYNDTSPHTNRQMQQMMQRHQQSERRRGMYGPYNEYYSSRQNDARPFRDHSTMRDETDFYYDRYGRRGYPDRERY